MTIETQLSLIPVTPLVGEEWIVALSELPDSHQLVGPEPDKRLIDSLRVLGQLTPLILAEPPQGRQAGEPYRVIAGRRRIKALRQIYPDTPEFGVRAMVYQVDPTLCDVLTLADNAVRRENPVSDLEAIERLLKQGADLEMIGQVTGLGKTTVQKRLRLAGLVPMLRSGLVNGWVALGICERIARLPIETQNRLADILAETGTVTGRDVDQVRQVSRQDAATAIPFDQIAGMGSANTASDPWQALRAAARDWIQRGDLKEPVQVRAGDGSRWLVRFESIPE